MCELVEVFSVTYRDKDGGDPNGTISVFDGKRGQIIYRRRGWPDQKAQIKRDHRLLLTGPYRAISADGCVSIEIDLHHGCKDETSSYVAEILIDVYDKSTAYDVAITKEVKTCSCDRSPTAEVTYAIMSDAVEATVEVNNLDDCFSVVACNNLGDIVLFESNKDNTCIEPSLARSVIAVPLKSFLRIDVRVHSNGQIVERRSLYCHPDVDSEHVLSVGIVEVKITCSD